MDAPFNLINGEKVDLSNPKHRDEVIARNKKLQSAIENGIKWGNFKITIETNLEITCPKCGYEIVKYFQKKITEIDDFGLIQPPNFVCPCCESHFTYSNKKDVYKIQIPKPKFPPPTKN